MVPTKPPNNADQSAAEGGEGRERTKGNSRQQNATRTQSQEDAPSALERVRQAAKRDAAAGVDGETWQHYGEDLEVNLQDLSEQLVRGAYRAKPVRRAYIAKADGRQRPLGVPTPSPYSDTIQ